MAEAELKKKFATGKTPTGDDFAELIEEQGTPGKKGEPGEKGDPGKQGNPGKQGEPGKDAEEQFTSEEVIALKALIEE